MTRIGRVCRRLAGLARSAGALAVSVPAVAATGPPLPPGWNHRPPMPLEYIFGPVVKVPGGTVVVGGMPGWQITLIAASPLCSPAAVAVVADWAWAEHRLTAAPNAWPTAARPARWGRVFLAKVLAGQTRTPVGPAPPRHNGKSACRPPADLCSR